ncbi:site-2 protease family protein [Candidatus Roizmanbacteria bacterium]|nr:site-2 protease family protein [Candidatus Roizmanbacteria bacterium]
MNVFSIIYFFLAFIAGITIHESAHAWMGNRLGDPTAKDLGRISLNPLRHIDLIGSIVLPLIGLFSFSHWLLGWAKPTPYNPANLKDGHKDEILIAIAGPISNLLLGFASVIAGYAFAIIISLTAAFIGGLMSTSFNLEPLWKFMDSFFYAMAYANFILVFFNLVPIPPLDGSSFLKIFFGKRFAYQLAFLNQYGFFILIMASFTPAGNILGAYLDATVGFCLKIVGFN